MASDGRTHTTPAESMWNLRTLAECVLDAPQDRGINVGLARDLARAALAESKGLVHELDPGRYRAVVRNGVPSIERDDTAGAVTAVVVPIAPELLDDLRSDWSATVQFRVDASGELVFRVVRDA